MMSEKRYVMKCDDESCYFCDTKEEKVIFVCQIVDLLNALNDENEKLRKELSDCEKFRYSVFKRIEKTIENKDNCAINKDAKYPCNAYDECLKRKGTNKPSPCMVNWMMGRPFENMIKKEEDDE